MSFLTARASKRPGKRIDFDLEGMSPGQNRCVCQANVSFDLGGTKKHTRASNLGIWLAFAARGFVFQWSLAIISSLTKQVQIHGLLAGVSF